MKNKKEYREKLIAFRNPKRMAIAFSECREKYKKDIDKICFPNYLIDFKSGLRIRFIVVSVKVSYPGPSLRTMIADDIDFDDIHKALIDEINNLFLQKKLLLRRK